MADVSNVNLIRSDRVENEITQTGSDNYACVRFVRFSSLKWIVGQFPRTFDKTSDKTRGDIRAVLADISVNLSKVALRRRQALPGPLPARTEPALTTFLFQGSYC